MTILKVAGPWYDGNDIPERTFTDPPGQLYAYFEMGSKELSA
jgi:hypothetical protein